MSLGPLGGRRRDWAASDSRARPRQRARSPHTRGSPDCLLYAGTPPRKAVTQTGSDRKEAPAPPPGRARPTWTPHHWQRRPASTSEEPHAFRHTSQRAPGGRFPSRQWWRRASCRGRRAEGRRAVSRLAAPPPRRPRPPGPEHSRGPGARHAGTRGSRCRRRAHSRGERAAHTLGGGQG